MTKKEFILKVIESLPDWKMWWGLKALIQNNQITDEALEKLYEVFKNSVHQTYNEIQQNKIKSNLEKVKNMKAHESNKKQEDLEELDTMFTSL